MQTKLCYIAKRHLDDLLDEYNNNKSKKTYNLTCMTYPFSGTEDISHMTINANQLEVTRYLFGQGSSQYFDISWHNHKKAKIVDNISVRTITR